MQRSVLLDLGNVVIGVDFRRVFRRWAASAGVAETRFYRDWQMDQHYAEHEVGRMSFSRYTEHLADRFDVALSEEEWRAGWNDIWTQPFAEVVGLLPQIAAQYPLYGFTNTNHTHAKHWRAHHEAALDCFQQVFVSSEIGHRKPDIDAFRWVCRAMHTTPDRVVFLDYTEENVAVAQACGIDARHVPSEADVVRELNSLLGPT